MKKSLICGLASLALAATPVLNTFALGTGSQTHDVTVGEVDETVYSVDLNWGSMTFDWKYARDINKFSFEPSRTCMGTTYQHGDYIVNREFTSGILYSDSSCSNLIEEEPEDGTLVYSKTEFENHISVLDNSTNGKVKVSASFAPDDNYDWLRGEFVAGGYWTDGESLSHFDIARENYLVIGNDLYYYYDTSYNTGLNYALIPEHPNVPGLHYADLVLKTASTADLSNINISSEDTIGTVTINIEPDLN